MKLSSPNVLSPEQRQLVYELFQQTADAPQSARRQILVDTIDDTVRIEVMALLDSHDQEDDLMPEPAMMEAARLLTEDVVSLFAGQQLGRYKILTELGEGGMGRVYKALDDIEHEVAIKVSLSGDEEWQNRFEREARTQAQLNHPNIATIYSREEIDGLRFLVLEYVPGETLAALLARQGRLSAAETAQIFSQIADALDFIHRAGRIHRDLKPSNVMITPTGYVKLLDFGIAKRFSATPAAPAVPDATPSESSIPLPNNEWLTGHAGVIGTLPFMSPERLRGLPIDERTDLWAFGVMLYESLTGQHPFVRATAEETRAAILTAPLDWKSLPAKTPPAVRTLLRLCLEKDPAARLREAAEAKHMLTQGAPASPWPLLRNFVYRNAPSLALAVTLMLTVSVFVSIWLANRKTVARRVSLTVTHQENTSASSVCQPQQNSEVIASTLINRLKDHPRLAVYLPRFMPKLPPVQASLAQAFGSDWTLRLTTNCGGEKFSISYDLFKRGKPNEHGEAQSIEELQAAILGKMGVQAEQISLSEEEQAYRNAIELLNQPFNQTAIASAIQLLKKLHDANPSQSYVNAALAKAYWYEQGIKVRNGAAAQPISQARKQIRELCQMNQTFQHNIRDVEAVVNCAYVFGGLGDYDQAIHDLEALILRDQNVAGLYETLARAYEQRGRDFTIKFDFDAAERDFNSAINYYLKAWGQREDWSTAIEIGAFYFEQGNYAEAAKYWEKAVEKLPNEPFGLSNLGNAYLYLGQSDRAVNTHLKASKEDDLPSLLNYGAALFLTDNCSQAINLFERGKNIAANQKHELLPELLSGFADACRCAQQRLPEALSDYLTAISAIRDQIADLSDEEAEERIQKISLLAEWLAKSGQLVTAKQEIRKIQTEPACQSDCIISSLKVNTLIGDRNAIIALLQKPVSKAQRLHIGFYLNHDSELRPLRDDPQLSSTINLLLSSLQ